MGILGWHFNWEQVFLPDCPTPCCWIHVSDSLVQPILTLKINVQRVKLGSIWSWWKWLDLDANYTTDRHCLWECTVCHHAKQNKKAIYFTSDKHVTTKTHKIWDISNTKSVIGEEICYLDVRQIWESTLSKSDYLVGHFGFGRTWEWILKDFFYISRDE
jgi:hypothetical protein